MMKTKKIDHMLWNIDWSKDIILELSSHEMTKIGYFAAELRRSTTDFLDHCRIRKYSRVRVRGAYRCIPGAGCKKMARWPNTTSGYTLRHTCFGCWLSR